MLEIHITITGEALAVLLIILVLCSSKMAKETTNKASKVSAKRSKKDPNAPKRGLSAYMFFSQANRNKVKEENPEASFGMYLHTHF
jgi:hypothetical protein